VRGCYKYEELPLGREPENAVDEQAVAVTKDSRIVVHVAIQFSSIVFHFLARPCNKGIAKVTCSRINRGVVSSDSMAYQSYLEKLQQLLAKKQLV